jgi:hypothetical protein
LIAPPVHFGGGGFLALAVAAPSVTSATDDAATIMHTDINRRTLKNVIAKPPVRPYCMPSWLLR